MTSFPILLLKGALAQFEGAAGSAGVPAAARQLTIHLYGRVDTSLAPPISRRKHHVHRSGSS
jgi:hypothetical protein